MSLLQVDSSSHLLSLRDTAARVVRARHSGFEGEDLVQEAWARTAVAVRDRSIDDPQAYAAAVAANLVRLHGRREASRQRWASRLFVRPSSDAPDSQVVLHEEQAAMAMALDQLPPTARQLLVAHTVQGRDTAALAKAAGTTPGAVAAGLARGRAILRVEYLIAFRHLPRPADRCLRILYAISAQDVRRQARLHADRHVPSCATCAALAETLRERKRPAVMTLIAMRLARWTGRWSQVDASTIGQRAGVAGGLVSMGVAGALVLAGSSSTVRPAHTAPQVETAAAAPMRMVNAPSLGLAHHRLRTTSRLSADHQTATLPVNPTGYLFRPPEAPVDPPVDPSASAHLSRSGVRVRIDATDLSLGAPAFISGPMAQLPFSGFTLFLP